MLDLKITFVAYAQIADILNTDQLTEFNDM